MLHHCEEYHELDREAEPEEEPTVEAASEAADTQGDVPMAASGAEPTADGASQPDASTSAPPIAAPPSDAPEEGSAEREAAAKMKKLEDKMREPYLHQAVATIGIALIAMGEEIGAEMSLRHFQHLVSCSSKEAPVLICGR